MVTKSPAKMVGNPGISNIGFLGYNSESCPPGCGKPSMMWHFNFKSPASNTVNNPVGPAPMMRISVSMILKL